MILGLELYFLCVLTSYKDEYIQVEYIFDSEEIQELKQLVQYNWCITGTQLADLITMSSLIYSPINCVIPLSHNKQRGEKRNWECIQIVISIVFLVFSTLISFCLQDCEGGNMCYNQTEEQRHPKNVEIGRGTCQLIYYSHGESDGLEGYCSWKSEERDSSDFE